MVFRGEILVIHLTLKPVGFYAKIGSNETTVCVLLFFQYTLYIYARERILWEGRDEQINDRMSERTQNNYKQINVGENPT